MFPLILSISLGLVLLFVILLLITEVAATYPVWRQFDSSPSAQATEPAAKGERNTLKIFLLVLTGIGILSIFVFMLSYNPQQKEATAATETQPTISQTKSLSATLAGIPFHFRLQTKWEGGKMYGNNRITLSPDTAWRFAECRYFLLDREGFLVKEMSFTPEDFVSEMSPDGRVLGYMNRFHTEMSLREYQKIEKLQVVIDKKFLHFSFSSKTPHTGLPWPQKDNRLG